MVFTLVFLPSLAISAKSSRNASQPAQNVSKSKHSAKRPVRREVYPEPNRRRKMSKKSKINSRLRSNFGEDFSNQFRPETQVQFVIKKRSQPGTFRRFDYNSAYDQGFDNNELFQPISEPDNDLFGQDLDLENEIEAPDIDYDFGTSIESFEIDEPEIHRKPRFNKFPARNSITGRPFVQNQPVNSRQEFSNNKKFIQIAGENIPVMQNKPHPKRPFYLGQEQNDAVPASTNRQPRFKSDQSPFLFFLPESMTSNAQSWFNPKPKPPMIDVKGMIPDYINSNQQQTPQTYENAEASNQRVQSFQTYQNPGNVYQSLPQAVATLMPPKPNIQNFGGQKGKPFSGYLLAAVPTQALSKIRLPPGSSVLPKETLNALNLNSIPGQAPNGYFGNQRGTGTSRIQLLEPPRPDARKSVGVASFNKVVFNCDGKTWMVPVGIYQCCGQSLYKTKTEACGWGNIVVNRGQVKNPRPRSDSSLPEPLPQLLADNQNQIEEPVNRDSRILTCKGNRFLVPMVDASFYGCCGSKALFWPKEHCDEATLELSPPRRELTTISPVVKEITAILVCDGYTHWIPATQRFNYGIGCCSKDVYDVRTQHCSNPISSPEHSEMSRDFSHYSDMIQSQSHSASCPHGHICCPPSAPVPNFNRNLQCCPDLGPFDPTTQRCSTAVARYEDE